MNVRAPKPDDQRFAFLDACYEAGELNWDSADIYMDNEDLIGRWFAANPGKREKIFLATKWVLFLLCQLSLVNHKLQVCRKDQSGRYSWCG